MNNHNYNSLSDRLKQNGFLFDEVQEQNEDFAPLASENFFEKSEADFENNFVEIPEEFKLKKPSRKRLNQYDLDLIKGEGQSQKPEEKFEIIKRFLNLKQTKLEQGKTGFFEFLFYKFFPKIYAAKLIKQAMEKFHELNIDAKNLLDKTIPYGEEDTRYGELVKYINCASEIQTRLKGKI